MTLSTSFELRTLLDQQRPATVLRLLGEGELPPLLGAFKAEALMALDRHKEAHDYLDPLVPQLHDDEFAYAERLWADILLRQGWTDGSILSAEGAARVAQSEELRAIATAWSAIGYARKRCWNLAESALTTARPSTHPLVLLAEARVRLEGDQRLEARAVYERMGESKTVHAQMNSHWGRAYVAYLLGAFDEARTLAQSALQLSDEVIGPLFVLAQVSLALNDVEDFNRTVAEVERRSPKAETLKWWKEEQPRLRARVAAASEPGGPRHRLIAFPTTVQRRDHCGPCTIELVLRYWKEGDGLSNDQIAQAVKFQGGGSPTYKMREFFHLVGFDTVRGLAPVDKLKALIDAGYPAIVQQEYSDSSHVAVVIGYDEAAQTIELQDPMTHAVTALSVEALNRLRAPYLDSAIIAFPRGQDHDKALARLGLFDDAAVVWTDQAGLALDEGRPQVAAELMARATQVQPRHRLSWVMWLYAESDRWYAARRGAPTGLRPDSLAAKLIPTEGQDPAAARARFYDVLERARAEFPNTEFIHQFEGNGALADGDYARAADAYQRATEADPDDARNFASLAECYFALREMDKAQDAAWNALNRYTSLAAANVWVARCYAWRGDRRAFHYARVSVELAPGWWLTHQALAEGHLVLEDRPAARRELDAALACAPNQLAARVTRARWLSDDGDRVSAAIELEAALAQSLPPIVTYEARQALCRVLFGSHLFVDAVKQIEPLLALFPEDAWAAQFKAAARAQALIHAGRPATADEIAEVRALYDRGLELNTGTTWVARDYVDYVASLAGPEAAVAVAERLRAAYPDNGALIYLHAQWLTRAGQAAAAARAMQDALARADGLANRDEMYDAVYDILYSLGDAEGERAVLSAPMPEGGAPVTARERALGLVLALRPEQNAERARELLNATVNADPEDAYAALRLGDVSPSGADREALYRRALLLAPRWAYARAHLAEFLIDAGRAAEALEYTDGHEAESFDVLTTHGRSLFAVGRYEESAALFAQAAQPASPSWVHYYKWASEEGCGRFAEALATAQQALPLFPDVPTWHVRVAESLRHLERYAEAAQTIEQGRAQGLTAAHVAEAEYETAWAKRDLEAALRAAEQMIQLTGEQAGDQRLGQWENKRLRLLLELGRAEEAQQLVAQENLTELGWGQAAWTAMQAEHWALCLDFAGRALALDERNFSGLFTTAEALRGQGREAEAVAAYQRLREAHPDEHNAYEKLALLLAVDGQADEALTLAERAVALGPFCTFAWATRGYVRLARGEREAALTDLTAAWNRADIDLRRHANEFWWALADLQGQPALAHERQQKAHVAAKTSLDQRVLRHLATLLGSPSVDEPSASRL